mgnify:CR=1 FL=1
MLLHGSSAFTVGLLSFLFLFEIYHNIILQSKRLFCVIFQVLCASFFVEVISLTVNDDYKRHVFHIKLAECFCSEVFISNKLCFFDAFCKKCSCTADAPKYTPSYFFIASTTSGRRAPFPIIPLALRTSWSVHRHPCGRWS